MPFHKRYRRGSQWQRQVKAVIYRTLQPEPKWLDTPFAGPVDAAAGQVIHLTVIPQGVGQNSRVGMDVTVDSLLVRFDVWQLWEVGIAPVAIRCMLLRWDETPAPTVLTILQSGVRSGLNRFFTPLFKVVRDQTILLDPIQGSFKGRHVKWMVNVKDKASFTENTGNSPLRGHWYALFLSDQFPLPTVQPQLRFNARVTFTDM